MDGPRRRHANALAAFGSSARRAIDEATDLKDADTADLFTEVIARDRQIAPGWWKHTFRGETTRRLLGRRQLKQRSHDEHASSSEWHPSTSRTPRSRRAGFRLAPCCATASVDGPSVGGWRRDWITCRECVRQGVVQPMVQPLFRKDILLVRSCRFVSSGRPSTLHFILDDRRGRPGYRGQRPPRTTAPNVSAIGDSAGSPQFTHAAFDDSASSVTTSREEPVRPAIGLGLFCMYTDRELARVGSNELEAKSRGGPCRVTKLPLAALLRTRTLSASREFMKMLIDSTSDRILGFTVFGVEATELTATVQTAMLWQLSFTLLLDAIFTHPTAAEGLTVTVGPRRHGSEPVERTLRKTDERIVGRYACQAFRGNAI